MRKTWLISVILFVLLCIVVILEGDAPQPIDWSPTLAYKDKNPFGTYILFERLPDLFANQTPQVCQVSPFEQENQLRTLQTDTNTILKKTWLIINREIRLGEVDTQVLIRNAQKGMHILLAAEIFSPTIQQKLNFEVSYQNFLGKDSTTLYWASPNQKITTPFSYKRNTIDYYFEKYPKNATILAYNNYQKPVFLAVPCGKGIVWLCSVPLVLGNYNLLHPQNIQFSERLLSCLPADYEIIWDEYQRQTLNAIENSIFRFILKTQPLRWAFYTAITAILLFIVFEGKRKQKAIPIILPPTNTSLEFVQLIGKLYYLYKDHKNIAEKKIQYFFEFLRTHFYLKTQNLDEEFCTTLATKADIPLQEVKNLLQNIETVQRQVRITENELWQLNDKIERFYQKINQ
ncbi:MAG: hypothetical protein NZ551_09025 [Microscillaceae bacterium]|nr:hypothetical protein [Microscillaceae bacterium]MDW8461341.1 hypothetical protein [Cytophagales bacterium]